MRKNIFFIALICSFVNGFTQITTFTSIEELALQKKIDVELKGLGGFQGEVVQIDIQNLTSEELHISLEAGRRLDNLNNSDQDILVVREQKINLNPNKSTSVKVFGFCCQAHNGSPKTNQEFSLGYMAKGNLLWIAQYLNDHSQIDFTTMQQAVWVFSDGNNMGSLMLSKKQAIIDLKREMCHKLGIEVPWYEIYYEKDSAAVFSDKHYRLVGPVEYTLPASGWLNVLIRNANRQVVYRFTNKAFVESGLYKYDVDLAIKDWPKGKYNIEIYLDDILKKQVGFSI